MKPLLEQFPGNNFLVTTTNWFFAPDGKQYRAAWGEVKVYNDSDTLGIKTNNKSSNWYAVVGTVGKGKSIVIAGCQIHYACVCMDKPNLEDVTERKLLDSGENIKYDSRTMIYIAQ